MSSLNRKIGSTLFVLLIPILAISGCAKRDSNAEELSKNYKQNHDYQSLAAILPHLNYTMTRSEIENLLGEPAMCPIASGCYYSSNQSVVVYCPNGGTVSEQSCQSFSLVLVVNYTLADRHNSSPQDILSGFSLTPIGE